MGAAAFLIPCVVLGSPDSRPTLGNQLHFLSFPIWGEMNKSPFVRRTLDRQAPCRVCRIWASTSLSFPTARGLRCPGEAARAARPASAPFHRLLNMVDMLFPFLVGILQRLQPNSNEGLKVINFPRLPHVSENQIWISEMRVCLCVF